MEAKRWPAAVNRALERRLPDEVVEVMREHKWNAFGVHDAVMEEVRKHFRRNRDMAKPVTCCDRFAKELKDDDILAFMEVDQLSPMTRTPAAPAVYALADCGDGLAKIDFCPFCGKKIEFAGEPALTSEAVAEFAAGLQAVIDEIASPPDVLCEAYLWKNGMVMAFDQSGNQMPDYQGPFSEVGARVVRDSTASTRFHLGCWDGAYDRIVPKEEWKPPKS